MTVLYYKPNNPIALIEAKDNNHSFGDGIQQGLDYAATLHIPFVLATLISRKRFRISKGTFGRPAAVLDSQRQ